MPIEQSFHPDYPLALLQIQYLICGGGKKEIICPSIILRSKKKNNFFFHLILIILEARTLQDTPTNDLPGDPFLCINTVKG